MEPFEHFDRSDGPYSLAGIKLVTLRRIDDYIKKTEVLYNGQPVFSSETDGSVYIWAQKWAQENHPKGGITYRFTSENVEIGGTRGGNYCEVFYDETLSDTTAPTVKRVMISDTENNPAVEFERPEDGKISICGGDFIKQTIEVPGYEATPESFEYYTFSPASLKVLSAPHGTDIFEEITLQEDADKFVMPFFGTYWSGSLKDIKAGSASGWYDLEVTITDPSGNYQKQLLSPAFYINPEGGITDIDDEVDYVKLSGRDILLPKGWKVYDCTGCLRMPANLQPGIYIVTDGSNRQKVIVK